MKLYRSLKPGIIYKQDGFLLPKGEKPGFGEMAFIVSPNKDKGFEILNNDFLQYKKSLYKKYYIDFIYKEKIGYKKYIKNNTGLFKKEFLSLEKDSNVSLEMVNNSNKVTVLKRKYNLLVNLGEWHDIYFKYQIKASLEKICTNYIQFLAKKINDEYFHEYNKVIYIDITQWINGERKLGIDRKSLTNPISIFLVSLYKFPDLLKSLQKCDIVFVNSNENMCVMFHIDELHRKMYSKVKQRLLSLVKKEYIDETSIEDSVIDDTSFVKPIEEMNTNEIVRKLTTPDKSKEKEIRDKIISDLTKNLLGDYEDVTKNFDEDDSEIKSDDESINEIKNLANNYIDEHPELLTEVNQDIALNEVTKEVKKKIYINEFRPKYTNEQLKNIQELADIQSQKIGNLADTIANMKTKTIEQSDYSDIVTTNNTNLVTSKFANFDKAYNEKKLPQDIDNMVGMLANTKKKIFIVDKKEVDSSTSMDLKKTMIYTLKDEDGKEMKIKFDVPIIFDDHYMYIKGNKKVIEHMLILKPLVKTGKDSVQIVTNYQKMFIMRKGSVDLKSNALFRFINKNKDDFNVVYGNGVVKNGKYKTTKEYNDIAKRIIKFNIDNFHFILDIDSLLTELNNSNIKYNKIDMTTNVIIGIDKNKNKPITMNIKDSFVDTIMSYMPDEYVKVIKKIGGKSNNGRLLAYSETKPLNKSVPLILVLLYFEGFKMVMEKAKIEYELIHKSDNPIDVDLYEWGLTELSDGYIKWKRYPTENSLLMNGLNCLPMNLYSIDSLESKDTYIYLLTNIYSYANQAFNLDQYYDFMIDPITKEILTDMHLPTDLVSLCLLANKMLKVDDYTAENDMNNMRIRSNEIIAYHTYKAITDAYGAYRKTQHRKNQPPLTINKDAVMNRIKSSDQSVMSDASILSPVLEISSLRKVTYKGESGTNMERAFKLGVRRYDESMIGVIGITTSNDGKVGINRQLTLEPNITSTRGYIDVSGLDHVDELSSANLLTPTELLTPLGVQHDDPARTAMAFKQTMYMLMTDKSDPVLVGNGSEKILPYHISSEFSIVAEDDGEIVDKTNDFVVIKYKSGKYRTIDTSLKIRKNSAAGFYIENRLSCNKNIGDKVSKNEVVAWNDKAFKKSGNNPEVAMRLGPLVKIAVIPEWDIYEDSAPITKAASEKMSATMVMPVTVSLKPYSCVSKIKSIGDKVNAGEAVIVFDDYSDDEDVRDMLIGLSQENQDFIVESTATTAVTHYTGTIVDIDVVTTVPIDQLSESLQKIVGDYWKKIRKRNKILDKYKNPGDPEFYKSGNIISKTDNPVKPDYQGKIGKEKVDEGVVITFYVSFKDVMARGDKLSSEFALKSTTSHVIEEGLEPYSEYRPDESIDLITAPLSISARKTPSIFLAMFANKILIEAKRNMKKYWEEN